MFSKRSAYNAGLRLWFRVCREVCFFSLNLVEYLLIVRETVRVIHKPQVCKKEKKNDIFNSRRVSVTDITQ